ncbi:murein biosynthesis integral membrane protein MurJ [Casimicrobium huifangae]|uniref:murein biosynthesis integral membrane protein MurJ n=1 Tax=Casimicrobium huifangae TaxID=2591109 RepID=UPI0012ECA905|nr:murein biosynthesis integral membrane protein MurJ [Casimicrobium huifangae]
MNLFKAIVSVSALTTLSRVAGLAREVVTAKVFGAGAVNDAFEIAFQLPNMMRRLFAEGAFAQAFVPLIAEYKGQRGEAATHQLINRVATLQLVALLAVTLLGILAAPWLIPLFASGFDKTAGKTQLATELLRIMFPYLLFISLTALAGGVMNIWKKFGIPAFTPVLLNAAMIGASLWAAPHFAQPIHALAWGVVVGGVLQLALQLWPLYKLGMFPRLDFHFRDEGVRRMLKTMAPAILGVSVAQVSLLINTNYSSFFGDGAVSWLKKADRLMELPTALLGVAIGTVILPALGALRNEKNSKGYGELLDYGMRFALLATLPAMAVMVVLAVPMIATIFERGAFTAHDALQTGPAVAAYAVGIVALVWIKILAPAFYAQQDTATPVKIAVRVLVITQLFNLFFVWVVFDRYAPTLKHAALALSTSLGAVLNAWWLYRGLRARGLYVPQARWRPFAWQLVAATAFTTVAILIARPDDGWWVAKASGTLDTRWAAGIPLLGAIADAVSSHWTEFRRIGTLASLFALGGAAYLGVLYGFGFRLRDVKR